MTEITISIDGYAFLQGLLAIVTLTLAVFVWKIHRLPHAMASNFSRSIAALAKTEPDGEAFIQLQQILTEAWDKKDWRPLMGLLGNPIATRAWMNLRPLLGGMMRQQSQGGLAYAGE